MEYGLAGVYAGEIRVPDRYFEGTLGGTPVSLGRADGDTLVFLVPEVESGSTTLTVKVGKETRSLELDVWSSGFQTDPKAETEAFLKNARELLSIIAQDEELKKLAAPYGLWLDFFAAKYSALSEAEKGYVAGVFRVNSNYIFFQNLYPSFEIPCINGPESVVGDMTYYFESVESFDLKNYARLPQKGVHEAVLSGFGMAYWYQKLLMEYYSMQIYRCPVLQEVKLLEDEKYLEQTDTVSFESKVRKAFSTRGVFRSLAKSDLEEGVDDLRTYAYGYVKKEYYSGFFAELIEVYVDEYDWKLPLLNPQSIVQPPAESILSLGPVHEPRWGQPVIDNPSVRLVNYKAEGGALSLVLDTDKEGLLPFELTLTLSPGNSLTFQTDFVISSLLDPGCSLAVDVLLKGRTHFLYIEFGVPPYQVAWSNGVDEELSQSFSPGDYSVTVSDAEGCARTVSFIAPEFGTVEDIDGNVYETVKVGDTWWMTENLRTTRLNNGTPIAHLESDVAWVSTYAPGYSRLNNDPKAEEIYGKLYNYYAACCDICPSGWTVHYGIDTPIYGSPNANYIRSVEGWPEGSLKANNQSGLRVLPGGGRNGATGAFSGDGEVALFWTLAKDPGGLPYFTRFQGNSNYNSIVAATDRRHGLSVRCMKQ